MITKQMTHTEIYKKKHTAVTQESHKYNFLFFSSLIFDYYYMINKRFPLVIDVIMIMIMIIVIDMY